MIVFLRPDRSRRLDHGQICDRFTNSIVVSPWSVRPQPVCPIRLTSCTSAVACQPSASAWSSKTPLHPAVTVVVACISLPDLSTHRRLHPPRLRHYCLPRSRRRKSALASVVPPSVRPDRLLVVTIGTQRATAICIGV
ncbi:hypothetical protein ACLOJK_003492 [Asimina triloba]